MLRISTYRSMSNTCTVGDDEHVLQLKFVKPLSVPRPGVLILAPKTWDDGSVPGRGA